MALVQTVFRPHPFEMPDDEAAVLKKRGLLAKPSAPRCDCDACEAPATAAEAQSQAASAKAPAPRAGKGDQPA